ncbi:30S ribosomal protein S14 [Methanonatronarchaeum sp. AMET6-2]|uniref:30S ribosomal protein S14 n=1 Tax=Methanonatronarchaeum sp. AMET6-2 TaxID=2933293 RepID=UPI0011FF21A4|nr:MAG: 30S ribosomal protein S14 [Methanonatronarchaeia archaeon]
MNLTLKWWRKMSSKEIIECRRCGRKQGIISRYEINLCRQCFREVAEKMDFKKYS